MNMRRSFDKMLVTLVVLGFTLLHTWLAVEKKEIKRREKNKHLKQYRDLITKRRKHI